MMLVKAIASGDRRYKHQFEETRHAIEARCLSSRQGQGAGNAAKRAERAARCRQAAQQQVE
ncbi:hypothetical protein O9K51_08219 [Purpureocillium lavendulum]|uniref:Uncharacterized protein n=1 Tax=Purpureocillium lavendulum TaxID=1247861 RepID=A0AB34FI11_9HYPO|nr:hypothetical protein O9K51_08219 [Purpureocillium lavendulum]